MSWRFNSIHFDFSAPASEVQTSEEAGATAAAAAGATTTEAAAAAAAAISDEPAVEAPNELPFQVQIRYTDTEGAVAMRVLTKTQPVTKDRQQAEKRMTLRLAMLANCIILKLK